MSAPETDYRDLAASLPPAAVSQYLAATGDWTLETRQDGLREVWNLSAVPPTGTLARPRGRIMLPLATDFVDFGQHFREALSSLALINDWTPLQLERAILGTRADRLLVGLDQEQSSDSIPLRQAETTVEAIYKMLRAAALTTATPDYRPRGRRLPGPVSRFLEEDVRLGHTQKGSFIFAVVAQLDAPIPPAPPGWAASRQVRQFSRRVMETLALGVQTARDLAQGGADTALTDPARWGLSADLIESLEAITQAEGLRSVELSFEWAVAEERPAVGGEPVRLDRDLVGQLAGVRERLLEQEEPLRRETLEPLQRETLTGPVVSLAREQDDLSDGETASVIISADIGARRRNVHFTLAGRQHDLAIQAYRLKLPIVVTGDLTFTRRTWRLEGNVELDEGALIRRITDAQPG